MIVKAKNINEVKNYVDSPGTLNTAEHAFKQGKAVFIGIPDDKPINIDQVINEIDKSQEFKKKIKEVNYES